VARALGNNQFQQLRSFLFPGAAGEGASPRQVSNELGATIDVERWVPMNRYGAHILVPAQGVGNHGVINFSTKSFPPLAVTSSRDLEFSVTDIYIQYSNVIDNLRLNTANGGGMQFPAVMVESGVSVARYSGDPPMVNLFHSTGVAAAPNSGMNITGARNLFHLPDMGPQQVIQFTMGSDNVAISMGIFWTERRPIGM